MTPLTHQSIEVETLGSLSEIEDLREEWKALERATPEGNGFQSFAWCRACYATGEAEPLVVAVRVGGRLVALLPLQRERRWGTTIVRWAGEPLTQYGDAVAEPGRWRRPALIAALAVLDRLPGVDLVALTRLRADGVLVESGLELQAHGEQIAAPMVDLGTGCGGRQFVKNVARREKRLAASGRVSLDEALSAGSREVMALRALAMKRAWLAEKGLIGSALDSPHMAAMLADLARSGALRCFVLRVGQEVAAIDLGLVGGGIYRSLLSCYEPRFAHGSPGQSLTARLIESLKAEGLAGLDLLAPAEPYKLAWATHVTAIGANYRPLSVRGEAAAWTLRRLRPLAKRIVRAASPLVTTMRNLRQTSALVSRKAVIGRPSASLQRG